MHLNLFTQCSPSPQFAGLWRHPEDRTVSGYRSLQYWTSLAQRLEAACIDVLFFGDSHGVFDVYRASPDPAIQDAVQVPSIAPLLVLSAAANVTQNLGFAVTYSTTHHAPYECARVFSSLDHLTQGRIAWNIVTSFLQSATANGIGEDLPHNDRYDRADEYIEIVRSLWEKSWDDDAVVHDHARNMFTDPAKVHEIRHEGKWFRVRGPHQCEPSLQRTPVLYQAGASSRGADFAARHAEVVFVTLPDLKSGAEQVAGLRQRAANHGRGPNSMKILQGSLVMLGRTREEARKKAELIALLINPEGEFAKWCAWTGFNMAAYSDDVLLSEICSEASKSTLRLLQQASPERHWTVGDLRSFLSMGWRPRRRNALFGTPGEVADQMEEWIANTGVDGFNLLPCPPSSGIDDICDLLVPELQRRGLFRKAYDPAERTLRERYFGTGHRYYGRCI
jgi:FMN-dependent oxidoreductase (nitrilotriacetate monooxygenase family)